MAAAVSAREEGAEKVLIIERDLRLGGILQQCIHTGFGLSYFNEELSGPEYAHIFIDRAKELGVEFMLNSMVLSIDGNSKTINFVNPQMGAASVSAKAIVLAMGCRERTRGAIAVPGGRPAGVFTAGTAQRFVNIQGRMVGKKAVILGSGDIGMIMARRLMLEGTKVQAVIEVMPYLAGLTRNKVQCLEDFGIPLYMEHTIVRIKGNRRVEGVTVAKVDDHRNPIAGTEFDIDCDTVLFSVGLIPENELSRAAGIEMDQITSGPVVDNNMQTMTEGIFACGNVLHVNDLADNVSNESAHAGKAAAKYAMAANRIARESVEVVPGTNVRYVVPHKIDINSDDDFVRVYFRVKEPEKKVKIHADVNGETLSKMSRAFVNPGEIESIKVDLAKVCQSFDGKLVINVD